jgi:hypothetical protein
MGRGDVRTGFWWGRPEVKRPFGRPRYRWEDNIKFICETNRTLDVFNSQYAC